MKLPLKARYRSYWARNLFNVDDSKGKTVKALEVIGKKGDALICTHSHSIVTVPIKHFEDICREAL